MQIRKSGGMSPPDFIAVRFFPRDMVAEWFVLQAEDQGAAIAEPADAGRIVKPSRNGGATTMLSHRMLQHM
ncbi:hypothetical protein [Alicyclobacillus shizuokensis]|uniref:hypothetical protein n=1 Tax=Alicyclobacillus shizuokensis TaxID=392014 RepID=UPI000833A26F|nr:hypothetical protein [Alicyclobacillus shizuokensis]MCL6626628.1 hypothetical protein [Alicyclobacillus shizuokensis]